MQMRWLGAFIPAIDVHFPRLASTAGAAGSDPRRVGLFAEQVCFCPRFSERFDLKESLAVGVPQKHLNEESRGSRMNFFSSWPELMKLRPHWWTWQFLVIILICCNTAKRPAWWWHNQPGVPGVFFSKLKVSHDTHFFFFCFCSATLLF